MRRPQRRGSRSSCRRWTRKTGTCSDARRGACRATRPRWSSSRRRARSRWRGSRTTRSWAGCSCGVTAQPSRSAWSSRRSDSRSSSSSGEEQYDNSFSAFCRSSSLASSTLHESLVFRSRCGRPEAPRRLRGIHHPVCALEVQVRDPPAGLARQVPHELREPRDGHVTGVFNFFFVSLLRRRVLLRVFLVGGHAAVREERREDATRHDREGFAVRLGERHDALRGLVGVHAHHHRALRERAPRVGAELGAHLRTQKRIVAVVVVVVSSRLLVIICHSLVVSSVDAARVRVLSAPFLAAALFCLALIHRYTPLFFFCPRAVATCAANG
mmetsp:Transcript_7173/g.29682  ORF Transcript_7173/g.29682 Transcript_7173/m.29682 type:complete len:327 (+) Transcript_7173:856-1836(+)